MRKKTAAALMYALVLFPPACFSQFTQDDFDVLTYTISIEFFPSQERLEGEVEVAALSLVDGLDRMGLDLRDNMEVTAVTGNAASFTRRNHSISIDLDRAYNQGEQIRIRVSYNGQPEADAYINPVTFSHQRNGISTESIMTEGCPFYAHFWWPCKDRPDDKPDSVHIYATVPSNLTVASNGKFEGEVDNGNGTRTHHWRILNPIATYLIIIQAANFSLLSDTYTSVSGQSMDLSLYMYPEDVAMADGIMDKMSSMLAILEGLYGEYPFINEKYGMAEHDGPWAGTEYQTMTCLKKKYFLNDTTILHEMAHQWFGDYVSPKNFHHSWVSEGFATYSEALWLEAQAGRERYRSYMNNQLAAFKFTVPIYREEIVSPFKIYHWAVYLKGAWVLHMLRHITGDSLFFQSLHIYLDRFGGGSADTEDLQGVFEEVSGLDLAYFFQQWIYEPGYPEYVYDWASEDVGNGQYRLAGAVGQRQQAGPEIYTMPLDITVEFSTGDTTFTVFVDEQDEQFGALLNRQPVNVLLDKDDWVLKTAEPGEITLISGKPLAEFFFSVAGQGTVHTSSHANIERIYIFDLMGKLVRGIPVRWASAQWDRLDGSGNTASPGVYLVQLTGHGITETCKVVISK